LVITKIPGQFYKVLKHVFDGHWLWNGFKLRKEEIYFNLTFDVNVIKQAGNSVKSKFQNLISTTLNPGKLK